jgi:hypothetical protein
MTRQKILQVIRNRAYKRELNLESQPSFQLAYENQDALTYFPQVLGNIRHYQEAFGANSISGTRVQDLQKKLEAIFYAKDSHEYQEFMRQLKSKNLVQDTYLRNIVNSNTQNKTRNLSSSNFDFKVMDVLGREYGLDPSLSKNMKVRQKLYVEGLIQLVDRTYDGIKVKEYSQSLAA